MAELSTALVVDAEGTGAGSSPAAPPSSAAPAPARTAKPPQRSRGLRWHRDFLIPLTTALVLGSLAIVFVQADTQYFQREKYDVILSQPGRFFLPSKARDVIIDRARQALLAPPDAPERITKMERFRADARAALEGDSPLYRIELYDLQNPPVKLVEEVVDKRSSHNTWKNSLLFRWFSRKSDSTVEAAMPVASGGGTTMLGRVSFYFTSPKDNAEIEALVVQWRIRLAALAASALLLYGALLKGILLPLRRVAACLERDDLPAPRLIARPLSELEEAYRTMARDAGVAKLSARLRALGGDPQRGSGRDAALGFCVREVARHFPVRLVRAIDIDAVSEVPQADPARPEALATPDEIAEAIRKDLRRIADREEGAWRGDVFRGVKGRGPSETWFVGRIDSRTRPAGARYLVLRDGPDAPLGESTWWVESCRIVTDEVRLALEQFEASQRMILQEKSRSNITLSRNLGHDLTNIIATSKLDLVTMRRFLNSPAGQWVTNPNKERLFQESLAAVLNSTRFLQETVNLYRSFAYLSRPKFEEVDAAALAREVAELFGLTLSQSIRIRAQAPDNPIPCVLEPRLIRLAIFNLLNNSVESIRRASASGETSHTAPHQIREDEIVLLVDKPDKDHVVFRIADTGTGIRTPDGALADAQAIERIFELGYSTKSVEEGEGLGLNWVKTIVSDFHDGRIVARNREGGGAEFDIELPTAGPPERVGTGEPVRPDSGVGAIGTAGAAK